MLKQLLAHPLTRGLSLDDPRTTRLRREIVREKGFLRRLYGEWYDLLTSAVPAIDGNVLELGSGGGFLDERLPGLITSDVFPCPGIDAALDARNLPFATHALRALLMVDVFHHIPDAGTFLSEATRCLRPGGVIAMIEPWVSPWSRFVYGRMHHEPFDPDAKEWSLPDGGPLSRANSALPWIVFHRDGEQFRERYPSLQIEEIRTGFPFSYLMSGGVSLRSLAPAWSYRACRAGERILDPNGRRLACFAFILLRRIDR